MYILESVNLFQTRQLQVSGRTSCKLSASQKCTLEIFTSGQITGDSFVIVGEIILYHLNTGQAVSPKPAKTNNRYGIH